VDLNPGLSKESLMNALFLFWKLLWIKVSVKYLNVNVIFELEKMYELLYSK